LSNHAGLAFHDNPHPGASDQLNDSHYQRIIAVACIERPRRWLESFGNTPRKRRGTQMTIGLTHRRDSLRSLNNNQLLSVVLI
jgi:hypothetical protein